MKLEKHRLRVLALRRSGLSQRAIAKELNINKSTVAAILHPLTYEHKKARRRKLNKARIRDRKTKAEIRSATERGWLYLVESVPRDTRTLAQRLMGEPIFERSALYHKQQG